MVWIKIPRSCLFCIQRVRKNKRKLPEFSKFSKFRQFCLNLVNLGLPSCLRQNRQEPGNRPVLLKKRPVLFKNRLVPLFPGSYRFFKYFVNKIPLGLKSYVFYAFFMYLLYLLYIFVSFMYLLFIFYISFMYLMFLNLFSSNLVWKFCTIDRLRIFTYHYHLFNPYPQPPPLNFANFAMNFAVDIGFLRFLYFTFDILTFDFWHFNF